jgi:hypothetical protein
LVLLKMKGYNKVSKSHSCYSSFFPRFSFFYFMGG